MNEIRKSRFGVSFRRFHRHSGRWSRYHINAYCEPSGNFMREPPRSRNSGAGRCSVNSFRDHRRSVGGSPAREVERETGSKTALRRNDEFDHRDEFIQRSATTHRDLVDHGFH